MTPADHARVERRFDERAARMAHAWKSSDTARSWRQGFTPLTDLTRLPYTQPEIQDLGFPTADALLSHWFVIKAPPVSAPPVGTVTFADGSTLSLPLQTMTESFRDLAAPRPLCESAPAGASAPPDGSPPCTALVITRAELVTGRVLTGRGEATVPMWRFTVVGLDRPVDRVAVAPSAMTQVSREATTGVNDGGSDDVTLGYTGVNQLSAAGGSTLTLRVLAGDCDQNIGPLVYEDADVVVVGAVDTRSYQPCDATLPMHRITVKLAAPIGGRVVLDVVTGHPLAVRDL